MGGVGVGVVGGAATGAAIAAAAHLWDARKRAKTAHLPFAVVSATQAEGLSFPNGHPLRSVVYVGDPGVSGKYYPVAGFHRMLFDAKVAEAIRLLRSLAATEVSIEYLQGFDQGANVDFSVSPPDGAAVEIGGGGSSSTKASSGAKATMLLAPSMPPHIPSDLVWFQSEPLWQELANARLESGLRSFTIDLRYTDDYGINANLKAKIANVGLELGGRFTEFRETVWKLSASFAEELPPGAV